VITAIKPASEVLMAPSKIVKLREHP